MNFASHKQAVWILFWIGFTMGCIASKKEDNSQNQKLLSWLLASGSNPVCVDYYSQENLCLKSPVAISEKCSSNELDRFQNGIQPASLQKREILEELLRCWSKCNSTFFLSYSSGSSCSFETETDYVTAKRSGSSNSGNLWRQCQSNCNTGTDSSYPKLKGISTTTTYWPYP
ncbi:hypothetical protein [Leptospira yasudae]|uniref:Lipoprotein n=1 Tax=Leptospira yasudae TaxID=2202201 RepID=A0A6N4QYV8_9LEPT|nr:hypothetical protein [Leptospira yasudae]TGL76999.1 hypothetical protein EHQ77_16290 [Leptospira yasudae]TGL83947.1 hypothetical protein EHQ72_01610 [Leptospira yasudae]TGL89965.1 hypothetical protein EHQ83_00795 [Leptospira yasudae]